MNKQGLLPLLLLASAGFITLLPASVAADMTLQMCINCHGQDGRGGDAITPIIAGLTEVVHEDALYAYMDGDRTCALVPIMCKMAQKLSEDQVVSLAAHFAALPFAPANEEFDTTLADQGKAINERDCAICHGGDEPGDPESGILHGQRKGYLRLALQQYAAGERKQLPAMQKKTTALSADDIEALVNFYASFRN